MMLPNYNQLATSKIRQNLLDLAGKGIESVLPENFMNQALKFSAGQIMFGDQVFKIAGKRVFVMGVGKASVPMAKEVEKILGIENIVAGLVVSNTDISNLEKIMVHKGSHPIPTTESVLGTQKLLDFKNQFNITEDDLIIFLVSGGGSALLACPEDEITFEDKVQTLEALIRSGMSVHEMTAIKKKLSKVKGGKLAGHFYPTPIISIVLSDVVGDNLEVISSGPLTPDELSYEYAYQLFLKYNLLDTLPQSIVNFFRHKTKQTSTISCSHVEQKVVANNDTALDAIAGEAKSNGWQVVVERRLQGESREVAERICRQIFTNKVDQARAFIYGGETTVTLGKSNGQGGRNQEFIATCLNYVQDRDFHYDWGVISLATDGVDFISESAGGIIDSQSVFALQTTKINIPEYLDSHNSYEILSRINSNIAGFNTGTNVCDIMIFLLSPKQ